MPIIEGVYRGLFTAGAPVAGTDSVQTVTIGGTPTGGTFTLTFNGFRTAPITWTATDATLIAAIDAALEALPNIGTGGVTTTDTTMTSGIGDATVAFIAQNGKKAQPVMTAQSALTGTTPTVAVVDTTPGVTASHRGAPKGAMNVRQDTGVVSINTGTAAAPTWTNVGAQT